MRLSLPFALALLLLPSALVLAARRGAEPARSVSRGSTGSTGLSSSVGEDDDVAPRAEREWPRTAPYRELRNVEGPWVDLVLAPVRPLAFSGDARLYAVDTHGSTVAVFGADGERVATWPAPWGPVSLALWSRAASEGRAARDEVVVVCRGTLTLARYERARGELLSLLPLPAEPSDILVRGDRAWIACSALDLVVEVDLEANAIAREIGIPAKYPVFLSFDGDDLLVAPTFSGNNSMIEPGVGVVDAGPRRVLDLADPEVCVTPLDDHDLYRIDTETGAVEPVARALGTVLFAQGTNPKSGEHWQLGTEANNKDPERMGEPAIRGDVVRNRIAFARLDTDPGDGVDVVEPSRFLDWDAVDPESGTRLRGRGFAQPCALDFDGRGHGFVAALGSNRVAELDETGALVREWDVGSIPRALGVSPDGRLFVYCWGSNAIEAYDLGAETPVLAATLDLGPDPMPAKVRRGRELYYSAERSLHGNASCNSCHIDGLSDMLAWDLSDLPTDDKGPLMTQILRGIDGTQPFHWRGDRSDLGEFNRTFSALFGGEPLDATPGGELDDFTAFVLGMANPANPLQDARRVVSDEAAVAPLTAQGPPSAATEGQRLYFENETITGLTCHDCHALPSGTSSAVRNVEPFALARRTNFKPVTLLHSWRKEQPGPITRHDLTDGRMLFLPPLGAGFSATGLMFSLRRTTGLQNRLLTPQGVVDVVSFVRQLDSGLAPATQRGWPLEREGVDATAAELRDYLMDQAERRNCDVVVFGESTVDGERRALRWTWDRATGRFVASTRSVEPVELDFFVEQARAGEARNAFLGLPVGMGRRFGVDADLDDLFDLDERLAGTDPHDPDCDGDGHPDGVELAHGSDPLSVESAPRDERAPEVRDLRLAYTNVHVAKVQFDTDEPARWRVRLVPESGPEHSVASDALSFNHTAILTELPGDTGFAVHVTALDSSGNEREVELAGGARTTELLSPYDTVVSAVATRVIESGGGELALEVDFDVAFKNGAPAPSHEVIARLFVNDELVRDGLVAPLTGADGRATFAVRCTDLAPGDVVSIGVESIRAEQGVANDWSMPDTPPHLRRAFVTYSGS